MFSPINIELVRIYKIYKFAFFFKGVALQKCKFLISRIFKKKMQLFLVPDLSNFIHNRIFHYN